MFQIDQLEGLAARQDCFIYSILKRNSGWAIQWYEQDRVGKLRAEDTIYPDQSWKKGLVVYKYYDTFDNMLMEELARLEELERLSERETAGS